MNAPEVLLRLLWQGCQRPAFDRFHDEDLLAMLHDDIVTFPGFYTSRIPIKEINLDQDHVNLRMFGQDLIQEFRTVMEGKTDPFGQSLFLFLPEETEFVVLLRDGIVFLIEPVQHEDIKIVYPASLQFFLEVFLTVFIGLAEVSREFFRQDETVPWFSLNHTFFTAISLCPSR